MKIPFTQTKEYLSWRNDLSYKTFYKEFFRKNSDIDFQIDNEKEKSLIAVAASFTLETKIGKILYCPYGPVFLEDIVKEEKNKVYKYLKELGKKEGVVFVRTESLEAKKALLFSPPIKTYSQEAIFQPRIEWWLDLGENENELYDRIHKDHKYSIRRAEREGIKVEIIRNNFEKYFDIFWNLLQETSTRDGFSLYEKKYYEQIFKTKYHDLKKYLVFTKLGEEYLSVGLVVIKDHVANLVFAGSKGEKRELGYNHLMQWEGIKESIKHECKTYNFGGMTDGVYGKESLTGVTNFKKRFGGYKKFHGKFQDIPVKKIRYILYILYKIFR